MDVSKGEGIKHNPQMWAKVVERRVALSTALKKKIYENEKR